VIAPANSSAGAGFKEFTFTYHPNQRLRFRDGNLLHEWSERYRQLFDEDDLRLARSQRYTHFFEWLAAVLLYEATGFLSLLEKYETACHPRKVAVFRKTVPQPVFDYVMANRAGIPDLFVYAPDRSNWFFCEVKGASDRLADRQRLRANELRAITGKEVALLWLKEKG
jgi:hypothetical protein